MEMRDPRRC